MLKIFVAAKGMANHRPRQHVESASLQVDDRRRSDADLRLNERATYVMGRQGSYLPLVIEEIRLPEWRIVGLPRVEGIHAIVLGGHEEHIMLPFPWNLDPGREQGLRINNPINFERTEFPKLLGVHVLRR